MVEQFGFTPENTLFGTCICPDEINNEKGDLADRMKDYWGECFPMGGIGGAPYVGKTGFMAFSHHVPENGNVLILFGPHVAISETGEVGKYLRKGQTKHSTACGACIAAYNDALAGRVGTEFDDASDIQQAWIRNNIAPSAQEISTSENPMAALSRSAYQMVRDELKRITNTKFGPGYLVMMGGIMINMPPPFEDHFEPLFFEAHTEGRNPANILGLLEQHGLERQCHRELLCGPCMQ